MIEDSPFRAADRSQTETLLLRNEFAELAGRSFKGRRDIYTSLGYQRILKPFDYRGRYKRGGIAKRIVEAFPKSTWRGGGELIEDEDPTTETVFESAWETLNARLCVWSVFERADILAGLGRYAIILLGAPGDLQEPLERCASEQLVYLTPFSERDVVVETLNMDTADKRFGLPTWYDLKRINDAGRTTSRIGRVHWTRVMHLAEGLLDDPLYGTPRLEAVWNNLDDLVKITGGGAEAFWKRADQGMVLKIDPSIPVDAAAKKDLEEQMEAYTHDLTRTLRLRGVDVNPLGSDVANFAPSAAAIIDLISATTGIPQRILMGSERGELASTSDQENYDDRVRDRRREFAGPQVVRPFVDRMVELGVLPAPTQYDVRWPEKASLTDAQKTDMVARAAAANQAQGETIITVDELREWLGLPPRERLTPSRGAVPLDVHALESALLADDVHLAESIVAGALA